ncbi:hypothetical protein ACFQS2_00720 [Brachybacterium sp. GCM10030267]|uniref:hypothetical protein n=1 Tax=unclassified Brachybacterium TaxID=2623841 RepID=UPI0036196ECD
MFGRAKQQQARIESLERRVRELDGLVGHLAERAGLSETERLHLRETAGPSIPEQCRRLVAEGKIIQAIKVYREQTGAGLAEAKDAIDAYRGRTS